MTKLVTMLVIGLLLLGLWFATIYNKLIRLIEEVQNNRHQIDIQLDRRGKVLVSLIEVVKKYMDYEKTTLQEIVALRSKAQHAGSAKERQMAEDAIAMGRTMNLLFEEYPELKADTSALQLQEEIISTENKLAFAKQAYNDSVERYKAARGLLVASIVVSMVPNLYQEFSYWGLPTVTRETQENYTVNF